MVINDEILLDLDCCGYKLFQSPSGYCFTTDSVFLSAYVRASANEIVLEIGSGSGVISFLIAGKTEALEIVGIEVQKRLYEMSLRSLELNKLNDRIKFINGDIRTIKNVLPAGSFDVVVSNPPYQISNSNNELSEKEICKTEVLCSLKDLVSATKRLLKYGGRFYAIIKANRLVDLISEMRVNQIEPKKLIPIQATIESDIDLCIIEGKRNGKPGFLTTKPIVIYDDRGNYTPETQDIYYSYKKGN